MGLRVKLEEKIREMMESNIIISDPEEFERKKTAFIKSGKDKIHILTDFDRTLTKGY